MNRYESSIPRVPFAFAAVAMSAITMALAVVAPLQLETRGQAARAVAASKTVAPAAADAAISPARIDVFGAREQKTAYQPARDGATNCDQMT